MRLLIADDEALARQLLRDLAERHGGLEVVAECRDGDEVAAALPRTRPELAILDVRMPGRSVFETLAAPAPEVALPLVVFASAYDRYALRAFEINAVDFLLKPVREERFAEALERARRRAGQNGVRQLARDLGPRPERLLVRDRGRIVPVPVDRIAWIAADGDYSRIHTDGKSFLVSRTLSELEARLDPKRFVRVHRSTIVCWNRIREITSEGSGRYRIVLADATVVHASRGYADVLRGLMV